MAGPSCRGPHSCRDIRQSGHHQSPNVQQTTELSPCSATYCHTATSQPAQSSKPVRARPAGLRSKASMSIETSAFLSQAGGSDWVTLGLGTVRKVTAWLVFVGTPPTGRMLTERLTSENRRRPRRYRFAPGSHTWPKTPGSVRAMCLPIEEHQPPHKGTYPSSRLGASRISKQA